MATAIPKSASGRTSDQPTSNAAAAFAEGKALRSKTSRSTHSETGIERGKRDIVAIIEASNADRLEELIPVRYSRMLESPFTFFRGSAVIQASDLSHTPKTGITVHACGDCHLLNFGGFASPERDLVFDINDFDETFPAPWEWDVKRLSASVVLAARWRRFLPASAKEAVAAAAFGYRKAMQAYAEMPTLAVWYARITYDDLLARERNRRALDFVKADLQRARKQTHEHVFHRLTAKVNGVPRIVDQPPLIYHPPTTGTKEGVDKFLAQYAATLREDYRQLMHRFRFVDAAIKVVGIGSVGTRCFIALMLGESNDPFFLQIKEARKSVLEPYVGRSPWKHQGERVVVGQRLMQAVSDIFLGWTTGPKGRDFYVRQLRDMKVAIDLEAVDAELLKRYAALCGQALARAHAKAGQAPRIAGYLGSSDAFDAALQGYAVSYADQVERDFKVFQNAVREGRIRTEVSSSLTAIALS